MKRAASFGRAPVMRRRRDRARRCSATRATSTPAFVAVAHRRGARRRRTSTSVRRAVVDAVPDAVLRMPPQVPALLVDVPRRCSSAPVDQRLLSSGQARDVERRAARATGHASGASPNARSRRTRPRRMPTRPSTRGRASRRTATRGSCGSGFPRSTAARAATRSPARCSSRKSRGSCGSSSLFVIISRLAMRPMLHAGQRRAQGPLTSRVSRPGRCRRATACRSRTRAATSRP